MADFIDIVVNLFTPEEVASGQTGFDAAFMSHIGPSAMVFIPSKDGKGHCPEEWLELAQLAAGARRV